MASRSPSSQQMVNRALKNAAIQESKVDDNVCCEIYEESNEVDLTLIAPSKLWVSDSKSRRSRGQTGPNSLFLQIFKADQPIPLLVWLNHKKNCIAKTVCKICNGKFKNKHSFQVHLLKYHGRDFEYLLETFLSTRRFDYCY